MGRTGADRMQDQDRDILNRICGSVVEAIGNTPLVALDRLTAHLKLEGRILAKLDYLMPGYSKKDRAARRTIENALADGSLQPGQTVVELTSGNMGTGLAITCAIMGHPFVAVMSVGNSDERRRMMEALGAEVILVPQAKASRPGQVSGADLALVEARAKTETEARNGFRADQFKRPANWQAHYDGTAPEIWDQSGGCVTGFCDFVGSGGTLGGCARFFAEKGVQCYGVHPDRTDHPIQGGGYDMQELSHLDGIALEGAVTISGENARDMTRKLARFEGVFGGFSGGANVAAAAELLRGPEKGGVVACVICDSGLKYLSTDLW